MTPWNIALGKGTTGEGHGKRLSISMRSRSSRRAGFGHD
jgi:hypothetical protein